MMGIISRVPEYIDESANLDQSKSNSKTPIMRYEILSPSCVSYEFHQA